MKNSSISKRFAPITLIIMLLSAMFLSNPASAAGTSGGKSEGTSSIISVDPLAKTIVSIDDPNLIPDLNSRKYKDTTNLAIKYTESNHIVSKALLDALKVNFGTSAIPFCFESQDLGITNDTSVLRWEFPSDYPLENFDLGLNAKRAEDVTDPDYAGLAQSVLNETQPGIDVMAIFFDFNYSGALASPVEITYIESGKSYTTAEGYYKSGYYSGIHGDFYYCPPNSVLPENIGTDSKKSWKVNSFNYTTHLNHMSVYMLKTWDIISGPLTPPSAFTPETIDSTKNNKSSSKNSSSNNTSSETASSSDENSKNYNPSTGSADSIAVILPLSLLSLSAAAFVSKKNKFE